MPGGAHIVYCVLEVVFIHGSNQPPPHHNACGHEIPLRTNKNSGACQKYARLNLSVNLSKLLRSSSLTSVCPICLHILRGPC